MNRHRCQRPARRRLVSVAAAALVLLTLSAGWEGPTRAAARPAVAPVPTVQLGPIDNEHLGGQSGRDIERQAEERSARRDLRRIRRDGFGPTPVLRTATARAARAGGGHGFPVLVVVALCVLLALPMIASRVSSRST